MRLRKVDCITYCVADLARAERFYRETLGLVVSWRDEARRMVGLRMPESEAEVVLHDDATIPNPDLAFLVDDVAADCVELRADGHRVLKGPFDVRCGKMAVLA